MSKLTKIEQQKRKQMIEHMKEYLKPGDRIFLVIDKVTEARVRHFNPMYLKDGDLYHFWFDAWVAFGNGSELPAKRDYLTWDSDLSNWVEQLGRLLYSDEKAFEFRKLGNGGWG